MTVAIKSEHILQIPGYSLYFTCKKQQVLDLLFLSTAFVDLVGEVFKHAAFVLLSKVGCLQCHLGKVLRLTVFVLASLMNWGMCVYVVRGSGGKKIYIAHKDCETLTSCVLTSCWTLTTTTTTTTKKKNNLSSVSLQWADPPTPRRQQLFPTSCFPPTQSSKLSSFSLSISLSPSIALAQRQIAPVNYLKTRCQYWQWKHCKNDAL